MNKATLFEYPNRELIELMLKDNGIEDGHWILQANFSFTAMNIGQQQDGSDASPAGIVAIQKLAIMRVDEPLPFSVDASKINRA